MSSPVKAIARRLVPYSLYRRYRRRKVAALIAGYPVHEVTHTYGAHTLRVRLADPLAAGWYDHDWDEPAALAFLREHGVLREGAGVLDLGAHQAVLALMLAREVGAHGHVLAVEAEPHNARMAEANRDLNDAANLTVLHAAGAAEEGVTSFAEGLNGHVGEHASAANVEVAAVTVDGLAARYGTPDLVLVDVEGYEGEVLKGAAATLANGTTSFLVEVHDTLGSYGGSAQDILEQLSAFDRYVAVEDDEPFTPLGASPPRGRFFVIALARDRRAANATDDAAATNATDAAGAGALSDPPARAS